MAPLDFGGAIVIPHRNRPDPSRPYISESRLASGFGPCGPLNHAFKIMKTAEENDEAQTQLLRIS